jgi:hypothetical protein
MSLAIFLILNGRQLSYFNQSALKSNKIIYQMFDYSFIFILVNFLTFKRYSKTSYGKISLFIGMLVSLIFIIITLKIGNRGVLIGYSIAFVYYICEKNSINICPSNLIKILKIAFIILVVIYLSQFIRNTRGDIVDLTNTYFSLSKVLDFFKFEELVFQDYATPAATLLYSINEGIVIPKIVFFSDVFNIPVILDYITLAEYISRLVSPSTTWGMGYYILTWGYNLIGYAGCFVAPMLILIIFKVYYRVFFYVNDQNFRLYIQTILSAYLILPIVRGQMFPFIKYIYVYFIPAIILYCIAIGVKITVKISRH